MPSSSLPSSPPSSPIPEKQSSQHDKCHVKETADNSIPSVPHSNIDENVKLERSTEREEKKAPLSAPPPPPEVTENKPKIPSAEEKQITHLHHQISALNQQIAQKRTSLQTTTSTLSSHSSTPASAIVEQHIKLLHTYNEIRDIGQGLMGIVAANQGCRVKDVYEELGVGEKD